MHRRILLAIALATLSLAGCARSSGSPSDSPSASPIASATSGIVDPPGSVLPPSPAAAPTDAPSWGVPVDGDDCRVRVEETLNLWGYAESSLGRDLPRPGMDHVVATEEGTSAYSPGQYVPQRRIRTFVAPDRWATIEYREDRVGYEWIAIGESAWARLGRVIPEWTLMFGPNGYQDPGSVAGDFRLLNVPYGLEGDWSVEGESCTLRQEMLPGNTTTLTFTWDTSSPLRITDARRAQFDLPYVLERAGVVPPLRSMTLAYVDGQLDGTFTTTFDYTSVPVVEPPG